MHRPRVFKLPTFFLGCLLVVAVVNLAGSLHVRSKVAQVAEATAVVAPKESFESRLAATSDPAELRALAAREHRTALAGDQLVVALVTYFKTLALTLPLQAGVILFFLVLHYLFEYRTPPPR